MKDDPKAYKDRFSKSIFQKGRVESVRPRAYVKRASARGRYCKGVVKFMDELRKELVKVLKVRSCDRH